jgi:hypothetical protein
VKALSKESHFLVVKICKKARKKTTTRRNYKIFLYKEDVNENSKTYPYEK